MVSFALNANGQLSATILTEVDSINVGEPLRAKLKINKPSNFRFYALDLSPLYNPITLANALSEPDSNGVYKTPDFEVSDLGSWSSFSDSQQIPYASINWINDPSIGKSYYEHEIEFYFWDPGVYKLKAADFVTRDTNQNIIPLEGTTIFVRTPQMNIDTTQQIPIKPIKGIYREAKNWKDYWLYIVAFVLPLLLILFLFRMQNRKKKDLNTELEAIPEPIRAPHIVALEKLKNLKAEGLWQKGEIKRYQSRLTNIIREYLSRRYQVAALEMTTDEITTSLKKRNFNPTYESQLREILTMADLIKFAKAKPPEDIHDRFLETAVQFVQQTQQTFDSEEE